MLARAVREVEAAAQRGPVSSSVRTKFQVVGLLVREERARVKADAEISEANRAGELKRLDGVATILAKTAARDTSLLALLAEDAVVSDAARSLKRDMLKTAGVEAPPDEVKPAESATDPATERRVVPQSVVSRQLANPFLAPDFSNAAPRSVHPRQLATWELLGPLLTSFERAASGASACMDLPEPGSLRAPGSLELMPHQAQVVAAAASGHRTFLLADEPGLGKTAQALLAAQATNAFPLLAVVPNVVKTNWAHEVDLWTPKRSATVIHGDGHTIDGFADIVVVNYEVLDRHIGWLGAHGFRGMVVDEAHFIKNRTSQRSQHVLQLANQIRSRLARPLMMALTGTPLINDIEDFRAIWQFLGWIDEKKPLGELMEALEETGLTPADPGFYRAARRSVIDLGIVRRRKVDVAADIPARRIADLPDAARELTGVVGSKTSLGLTDAPHHAEHVLARRRRRVLAFPPGDPAYELVVDALDHDARGAGRERALVTRDESASQLLLCLPDRAAGLVVELDGEVCDPPCRDVGGHVDLASADDAEIDHAPASGGEEAWVCRSEASLLEGLHQLRQRHLVVDPAEELPDGPEVLDVVDQRSTGQGHPQRSGDPGPDPLGELEHVLGALRGAVLDEVRLVDDHATEAVGAEPADVSVEDLVVDDDDVGEPVDRVPVAVDDRGRPIRGPDAGLPRPVGLHNVRDDDEQRVGIRGLSGQKSLRRLAQAGLVRE